MFSAIVAKLFNTAKRKHSKENANTAVVRRSAYECRDDGRRLQNPNKQYEHLRTLLCDGTSRCRNKIRLITVGNLRSASPGKTNDAVVSEWIIFSVEEKRLYV